MSAHELVALGILVAIALTVRLYRLGDLPDTVLADEADNVQAAVRVLHGLTPLNGFFGLDWTQQPAFSIYKEAAFIAVFGFNIVALRLPSALISALSLVPFYLLVRRQFSLLSAFGATLLLSTNVWFLNFSRSGWNCIDIAFYMLMAMLFLMLALDQTPAAGPFQGQARWYFGAAGAFCALGLYGYPAGRAITVAVLAFVPLALFHFRSQRRLLARGFALLFLVEAILFAPQAAYILDHWELFNGRTGTVAIVNSPNFQADPARTMLLQLNRNLRAPWDGSVNNAAQYSPRAEPQLNRLAGLFALVGMVLSIALPRLRRRPETWLWWLMLLSGWISTQLFTVGTPNGARGIGYVPTLMFFAAAGLDSAALGLQAMAMRWRRSRPARKVSAAVLATAIVAVAILDLQHYVDWQTDPRTRQDRFIYLTSAEFPRWAAHITQIAVDKGGTTNLVQWREAYPIADPANPNGAP